MLESGSGGVECTREGGAAIQRSASRRATREAVLLKRVKTMERSRRSFLYLRGLKRAAARAKAEVQALMSRVGMTTGREGQLKRWSEWSQERRLL